MHTGSVITTSKIEREKILKPYLILCEGKDAEMFLINYLNNEALAYDQRFSNDIQVFDFGGNDDLSAFLMNLKNMDNFYKVTSLSIIRDAEKDYTKACQEVISSLNQSGFIAPEQCGTWVQDDEGRNLGFMLFPLNNAAGTLEDLCLKILSEPDNENILSLVDRFLLDMEKSYGRCYNRKHKNRLHTYFASSDKYVGMLIGTSSKSGAIDWTNNELEPLKVFLENGFHS